MTDVEASSNSRPNSVENPYTTNSPFFSTWHPVNVIKRCLYMGLSLYGLHYFKVYDTVMHSEDVRHEWFKFGVASSVALLFVKAYVEIYAGKLHGRRVEYKNFKQSTHAVMALLTISSVAFHMALWPAYASKSLIVMSLIGFGIFHFCMLMPTEVQNLVAFALLTFFIQEYK